MYVDKMTFDRSGTKLYYINPYGVMEHNGLFTFPNGAMGFAKEDGDLVRGQFWTASGNCFYFHSSGYSAQGLITDGYWCYNYDKSSMYLGKFMVKDPLTAKDRQFVNDAVDFFIDYYS